MKTTSVNITTMSMVGIQSAYSEVGHNSEKLGLAQNRGEESMSEFPAPESCT